MTSLKDKFQAAVEIVQNLPKDGDISTTNEEKLTFYSLFKQSTVGPCNVPKPGFWNLVEKYKWEAWSSLDDLSNDEAMKKYVQKLQYKVDEANKVHRFENWMTGDLYEKLKPMFEKIERPMVKESRRSASESSEKSSDNKEERNGLEIIDPASPSSIVSESEYIDAVEEDIQIRSRTSSYGIRDNLKVLSESEGSGRIEEQLQVYFVFSMIAERIDILSGLIETRNNHLMEMLKKATVYMFIPKKVSWLFLMFLIVWPFIAHALLRLIKRYLMFRF